MSAVENISNHGDELQSTIENMQSLMAKSETGAKMLESSQQMGSSDEMMKLMELVGEPSIPESERMKLSEYMGQLMQKDPANGLNIFAKYLEGLANHPDYEVRKEYYNEIADSARKLNATDIYHKYIADYKIFDQDDSQEAQLAKKAMNDMQEKMKQWASGEDSENNDSAN